MTRSATRVLGDDLEGIARNAARHLRRDVDRASDDAEDAIASAAKALTRAAEALSEEARAQARAAAGRTVEDIRSRPLAAVGAAAAVGVLVGFLLSRRS
jgi:ElaB/YqjD/DUF883 family membrane-anchored ribosome-binding protein